MYSYIESQRDTLISQIYLIKYSTCFGHVHCPSSAVSEHGIRQYMLVLLASASRRQQK
jgi:hypothetical protein